MTYISVLSILLLTWGLQSARGEEFPILVKDTSLPGAGIRTSGDTINRQNILTLSPTYETAPIIIGSKGRNKIITYLNADLLDGYDSTDFLTSATIVASYQPLDADLTDLGGLTAVLGDIIYGAGAGNWAKLGGNATPTRSFLMSLASGVTPQAPIWDTLASGDIPADITRDAEWNTASEINAATTDDDFITSTSHGNINHTDAMVSDTITVGASGSVNDAAIPAGITRDTEWDTASEINAATTDTDFVTSTTASANYQPLDADLTDLGGLSAVLGDVIYGAGSGNWAKLSGNATSARSFLMSLGAVGVPQAPIWDILASGDIPDPLVPTDGTQNITGALTASGALAGTTLDTGQGANDLYDMDQNVLTTSSPQFANVIITNGGNIYPTADATTAIGVSTFAAPTTKWITFDTTNKFVGVGATPSESLQVDSLVSAGTTDGIRINAYGPHINFLDRSSNADDWQIKVDGNNLTINRDANGTTFGDNAVTFAGATRNATFGAAVILPNAVKVGGTKYQDMANHGNTATTASETLGSVALPAGFLAATGDNITLEASGVFGANGNDKEVWCAFGTSLPKAVTSGVVTYNAKWWHIRMVAYRTGATSQRVIAELFIDGIAPIVTYSAGGDTLSGEVTVCVKGQSPTTGATDDVVEYTFDVKFNPAP